MTNTRAATSLRRIGSLDLCYEALEEAAHECPLAMPIERALLRISELTSMRAPARSLPNKAGDAQPRADEGAAQKGVDTRRHNNSPLAVFIGIGVMKNHPRLPPTRHTWTMRFHPPLKTPTN